MPLHYPCVKECQRQTKDEDEETINPYETLTGHLRDCKLPAIGFNSGRYDINVVKKVFIPYLLKHDEGNDETRFVIKIQNHVFRNE